MYNLTRYSDGKSRYGHGKVLDKDFQRSLLEPCLTSLVVASHRDYNIVGVWTLKIDMATRPFLGLRDKRRGGGVKKIVTGDMALS